MKTLISTLPLTKIVIAILCLSVLLCSCSHYYYVSNVQNVPLFKAKKEYRISGSVGAGDYSSSVEAQVAVSVTEKMAIMANFMRATGGDIESTNYGKGNYLEGALGYFRPIKRFGVFEIYGGVGGCRQHHKYAEYWSGEYYGKSDLSFGKLFIQPSFGFTSNAFDIAFSTRFCGLTYFDVSGNASSDEKFRTLSNKSHLFLEPAITLRVGWKYVKAQIQFVYSGYLNNPKLYFNEEYHISIGLQIALSSQNQ